MDKPKGNTITIKLNGEEQEFSEKTKRSQPEDKSDSFPDVINIDPPEMEEEAVIETAAAQESVDESFDWIIPEPGDTDLQEYKFVPQPTSKKGTGKKSISFSSTIKMKKGNNIGSILFSAFFAILIGIAFGFMMLKLVIADHGQKASTLTNGTSSNDTSVVNGTVNSGTNTASTVVKALNAFVIQEGIYSSKDAAESAAKNAASNGLPTKTITINGKQYLFVGVADTQDNAKKLGSLYKQNGIDVFSKPLVTQEKKASNLTQNEKSFLEAAGEIYQSLAKATSSGIISNSASMDTINGIDQLLNSSGGKSTTVKNLRSELAAAEEKVKSYEKTKDQTSLTDAQQHLLNFLAVYYSM